MNGEEHSNLYFINQPIMEEIAPKIVSYLNNLIAENSKLPPNDVLFATYLACVHASDEQGIFNYKEFIERVQVWNSDLVLKAREGFELAEEQETEEETSMSPMTVFAEDKS